jgi:hypothetical protein
MHCGARSAGSRVPHSGNPQPTLNGRSETDMSGKTDAAKWPFGEVGNGAEMASPFECAKGAEGCPVRMCRAGVIPC